MVSSSENTHECGTIVAHKSRATAGADNTNAVPGSAAERSDNMDATATRKHRLPHSCGGCNNRWGGTRTAHCATCHHTFSTPANFDLHRAGSKDRQYAQGECSNPAARGLMLSDRGVWTAPGRDEDAAE